MLRPIFLFRFVTRTQSYQSLQYICLLIIINLESYIHYRNLYLVYSSMIRFLKMLKRKIDIYRAETQLIFILENYEWDADIKDYENERSKCRDFNA